MAKRGISSVSDSPKDRAVSMGSLRSRINNVRVIANTPSVTKINRSVLSRRESAFSAA